ncbi:MAG: hypothetical protein QMD09_08705 [Desulfatibacillaceae bacterium]|nr:hypothetical protein [Desulfatibacillaceae bacterium]
MSVATGRKISAKIWGLAYNLGHKAFLPLFFAALALVMAPALCPAPAKAQNVDAWLVGYSFECCPDAGGQSRQFLVLAYGPYPLGQEAQNQISYFKFQVFGRWSTLVLADAQERDRMQDAVLGRPYAGGSQEVKDFQRAVDAPVNGFWTEETWRAVYDYFAGPQNPKTAKIGSRTIKLAPLLAQNLDSAQRQAVKDAVENADASRNRIPFAVLDALLRQAASPPASPVQAGRENPAQGAGAPLPGRGAVLQTGPYQASSQQIDGWLLGFRFDCCPGRDSVPGQYLSLGLFAHPIEESGVFVKYLASGNAVVMSHDNPAMTAMRDAILGREYVRGSAFVRDFQRAVGATPDGIWGNGTWLALFAYFDRLAAPRTLAWQNRRIRFVPLHNTQLGTGQKNHLASRVKNDRLAQSQMDLAVFRPLLTPGPDPAQSGIYELSPLALELVWPLDLNRQEPARQMLEALAPEHQMALAEAALSLGAPRRYTLLNSSIQLAESAGENASAVRAALASLSPEQQRAIAELLQKARISSPALPQSNDMEIKWIPQTPSEEHENLKELVDKLKKMPDDLKARLKEAGINPYGAFDHAQRQGLLRDIAQAWDELDGNTGQISVSFLYPLILLAIIILILALVSKPLIIHEIFRR